MQKKGQRSKKQEKNRQQEKTDNNGKYWNWPKRTLKKKYFSNIQYRKYECQ